ncbi:MAG: hypothetical protein HC821_03635 [Lewinella sp.]|nr:hypothetical protein [Lewinella sp.]
MDEKHEKLALIDAYLLGELTSMEQQQFEAALVADPALAAELAETRAAIAALDIYGDQLAKSRLAALEQKLKTENSLTEKRKPLPRKLERPFYQRNWVLAAAMLLLLLAGWWLLAGGSTPSVEPADLFAANFEPYQNIVVSLTRGRQPTPRKQLTWLTKTKRGPKRKLP